MTGPESGAPAGADGAPASGARGFSLLELLTVTVLLGILAAIALPVYRGFKERAATGALQTELRTLNNAQELYFVEHDAYTDDVSRLQYSPGEDVRVELRAAGGAGAGWTGRLTHGVYGVRCAVFHGSASPLAPATDEGSIACDEGG